MFNFPRKTHDNGVVSYGLRYYGLKGFEHDIKWVPKAMEPVAREACRRIRTITQSARALAKHLETKPAVPFLFPGAPQVGVDDELTREEKAAYLRHPVPNRGILDLPKWRFRSIREHWEQAGAEPPKGFPVFYERTGLKWSEALFCVHRHLLHGTMPTDWYGLPRPTANTVNDLLRPTGEEGRSVEARLPRAGREPDPAHHAPGPALPERCRRTR